MLNNAKKRLLVLMVFFDYKKLDEKYRESQSV